MPATHIRKVRDCAGKAAYVRSGYDPSDECVEIDDTWAWFVCPRTGRYYVVSVDAI